ncbi:MAG: hypothetical protein LBF88_03935 [Planctomycetaceae bacterium]|nr:hypothetical protein [Planctomycetaceae bacterium]
MEYTFSEKYSATKLTNEIIAEQSYSCSGLVRFDKINKRFFVSWHGVSGQGFITKVQTISLENSKFIDASIEGQLKDGKENLSQDDYRVASYLDPTQCKLNFNGRLSGHARDSILAFGIFSMGKKYIRHDIHDAFQKMNLNVDQQKWQGHDVYRLIGVDEKVRYELWLDPTLQFMPVRISLYDNEMERNDVNYFTFDFVVESFRKLRSIPLPKKYIIKMETAHQWYEKNVLKSIPSKETLHGEINVTSVGKSFSEKDFKITMPIPNYTEVSMQDDLQTQYVWLNGEIVPLTDELALARIRGHGFMPGVREPRFWFIATGAVLIFLSLFFKIKTIIQNWRKK